MRVDRLIYIDCKIERLRELVEADKEGICWVSPCKVGDTVWIVNHHLQKVFENKVSKVVVCYESDNKNYIETIHIGKCGTKTFKRWKVQQFGKTVFKSEKEAVAALKGEMNGF